MILSVLKGQWSLQSTCCTKERQASVNEAERKEPEVSTGQDFLSCPASYLRPGGRQDRTKTKNASCPTGQDTRSACFVLSSDEHFLSCPASYLRPGGRQDRTKTKNASCPVLSSEKNGILCMSYAAIQQNIETRPFNAHVHSIEITQSLYKTVANDNMSHERLFVLLNHFGMQARCIDN